MTLPLSGVSRSFAEDMFRTGCSCVLPSVLRITYRVVDLLEMMMFSPGWSQPCGAAGLNMPQAPNAASSTAVTIAPGTTARSGRGQPSSVPFGVG